MFWSDWEQSEPRIERSSLAGRGRGAVVRAARGAWPNGLALDVRARRLYWADARADALHSATYDGADPRLVLTRHPALAHPFALALLDSHVYWSDWHEKAVLRANKWNGSDVTLVHNTLNKPFEIKVRLSYLHNYQTRFSNR